MAYITCFTSLTSLLQKKVTCMGNLVSHLLHLSVLCFLLLRISFLVLTVCSSSGSFLSPSLSNYMNVNSSRVILDTIIGELYDTRESKAHLKQGMAVQKKSLIL